MAEKQKILIVDDDENIAELISLYLTKECYETKIVGDGEEALAVFPVFKPNLVLLDLMLPGIDGYQVCRELRTSSQVPIIMLSAKGEIFDKVLGLELGADDYMAKPFDPLEIVARVNSNLRRFYQLNTEKPKREESYILKVGDLSLDTQTLVLKKKGEEVLLTPMEYKILALLMKKPGTIYTKVQIYESTSGEYFESDDNTIMVHISNLRDKIEDNPKNPRYIKTIRGVGYKIEDR